jgi:hypothetical protein
MVEKKAEECVFEHIKKVGKPIKATEIREELKLTGGQVAGSVYRLALAKKIKKTAPGTYCIILEDTKKAKDAKDIIEG